MFLHFGFCIFYDANYLQLQPKKNISSVITTPEFETELTV